MFGDETNPIRIASYLFSKDSKYIILTMGDPVKGDYGELMFINTETYQMDYRLDVKPKYLAISEDGSMLAFNAYGISDIAVTIINTQTHEIVGQIPGNPAWVVSMAFSPDGRYLSISWQNGVDINIYSIPLFSPFQVIKSGASGSGGFTSTGITENNKYVVAAAGPILVLFKFLITGISDEENINNVLYPNPANNSITISINLPIQANLSFNLYDISGKMISHLKNQFYTTGLITEQFDLGNLPSGTYIFKVESLNFNKTFKIIVKR